MPTFSYFQLILLGLIVTTLTASTATVRGQSDPAGGSQGVRVAELSPEAERAIDRGLRYIARSQQPSGSFGGRYATASTAAALMAYMVQGHFPDRGEHGEMLAKAVDYIVERGRRQNGYLGGNSHGMYEHALGTLALAEVWGESDREDVRDALKAAVDVIFRAQHRSGGWRYSPQPTQEDLSVAAMVIVALAAAKEAGILVPDKVINDAVQYLRACQNPFDGGFRYQLKSGGSGFARSAAGTMAMMITGHHDSIEVQRGMKYLLSHNEDVFTQAGNFYYAHYYAIQVMYQTGDRHYQNWYPKIRDQLIRTQRQNGSWRGSRGGEVFSTGMSILILGVPYRYLPIYQR